MNIICRIPLKSGENVPQLECVLEDGFMVVCAPPSVEIVDAIELCQHMRCRTHVAKGVNGQNLNHCEEHAAYYRSMQRQNYTKNNLKNELGLCAYQGCNNLQAQNRKTGNVGRCCTEHAEKLNQASKTAYKRRKDVM